MMTTAEMKEDVRAYYEKQDITGTIKNIRFHTDPNGIVQVFVCVWQEQPQPAIFNGGQGRHRHDFWLWEKDIQEGLTDESNG